MTPPPGPATLQIEQALASRTRTAARRALTGAGAATFTALDTEPGHGHDVIAHGLTDRGDFLMALARPHPAHPATRPTRARCDIRREAAEPRVRITAATVHLLGTVEWLTETARTTQLHEKALPETITTVAEIPDIMIGTLQIDRLIVHDSSGAVPLPLDGLLDDPATETFPHRGDALAAHEIVAAHPATALADLCTAVKDGHVVGRQLSERPHHQPCRHIRGKTFCVDTDAGGVTLMHIGERTTDVVYAAFRSPVRDLTGLRVELDHLIGLTRN
ncbi:hypothetical protein SAMN05421595_0088 [Austwickia chelonae]|uniref:DUF2470 domain-containing protein n=1 Tax=Austwickia chelonae NBRC 105200 TaxID=1184607 RepID=K6WAK8_9MICO|nr:hypothetical protein [Austwickia chelonae]GAB78877.1 hypothetical protein AUCHE_17_00890 [Austwickia chelonae NBRC 105200]SEV85746.1 hypothetical protein SAMN05421595_0088 [Austwickia chelonae]